METKDDLVVEGYHFATLADAETARMDLRRIKNLENSMDYRKPQNALLLYHRVLETRVLQTPIGFAYLLTVQEHLKRCGVPENKIKPIPLYMTFTNKTEANSSIRKSVAARQPEYKGRFITSVCLNVLMLLVIASMFAISLKSDSPNIINYRRTVVNEYSEWEQELTRRERAVREAEQKAGITP